MCIPFWFVYCMIIIVYTCTTPFHLSLGCPSALEAIQQLPISGGCILDCFNWLKLRQGLANCQTWQQIPCRHGPWFYHDFVCSSLNLIHLQGLFSAMAQPCLRVLGANNHHLGMDKPQSCSGPLNLGLGLLGTAMKVMAAKAETHQPGCCRILALWPGRAKTTSKSNMQTILLRTWNHVSLRTI